MDNEANFSVKISLDGQDKLIKATSNSNELGTAINKVSTNITKLNEHLINTNQRIGALNNLSQGAQQLMGG